MQKIHSLQVLFGKYVIHVFCKDMKIYCGLEISSVTVISNCYNLLQIITI